MPEEIMMLPKEDQGANGLLGWSGDVQKDTILILVSKMLDFFYVAY